MTVNNEIYNFIIDFLVLFAADCITSRTVGQLSDKIASGLKTCVWIMELVEKNFDYTCESFCGDPVQLTGHSVVTLCSYQDDSKK